MLYQGDDDDDDDDDHHHHHYSHCIIITIITTTTTTTDLIHMTFPIPLGLCNTFLQRNTVYFIVLILLYIMVIPGQNNKAHELTLSSIHGT
jgi:hypothetical protein